MIRSSAAGVVVKDKVFRQTAFTLLVVESNTFLVFVQSEFVFIINV